MMAVLEFRMGAPTHTSFRMSLSDYTKQKDQKEFNTKNVLSALYTQNADGRSVCIQSVPKNKAPDRTTKTTYTNIVDATRIYSQPDYSQFLVSCIKTFEDQSNLYIVTEFFPNTLAKLIEVSLLSSLFSSSPYYISSLISETENQTRRKTFH